MNDVFDKCFTAQISRNLRWSERTKLATMVSQTMHMAIDYIYTTLNHYLCKTFCMHLPLSLYSTYKICQCLLAPLIEIKSQSHMKKFLAKV